LRIKSSYASHRFCCYAPLNPFFIIREFLWFSNQVHFHLTNKYSTLRTDVHLISGSNFNFFPFCFHLKSLPKKN
jgi:hypothetical protein